MNGVPFNNSTLNHNLRPNASVNVNGVYSVSGVFVGNNISKANIPQNSFQQKPVIGEENQPRGSNEVHPSKIDEGQISSNLNSLNAKKLFGDVHKPPPFKGQSPNFPTSSISPPNYQSNIQVPHGSSTLRPQPTLDQQPQQQIQQQSPALQGGNIAPLPPQMNVPTQILQQSFQQQKPFQPVLQNQNSIQIQNITVQSNTKNQLSTTGQNIQRPASVGQQQNQQTVQQQQIQQLPKQLQPQQQPQIQPNLKPQTQPVQLPIQVQPQVQPQLQPQAQIPTQQPPLQHLSSIQVSIPSGQKAPIQPQQVQIQNTVVPNPQIILEKDNKPTVLQPVKQIQQPQSRVTQQPVVVSRITQSTTAAQLPLAQPLPQVLSDNSSSSIDDSEFVELSAAELADLDAKAVVSKPLQIISDIPEGSELSYYKKRVKEMEQCLEDSEMRIEKEKNEVKEASIFSRNYLNLLQLQQKMLYLEQESKKMRGKREK